MSSLLYGTLLFILAFIIHLIIWRIHLPKRQTKTLLTIFFGVLFGGSVLIYTNPAAFSISSIYPPDTIYEYLHIGFFYTSLTLAYMITYSAIEADSPSLLIVLKIAEAGEKGFNKKTLNSELDDSALIQPRLDDLLLDKMAILEDGKYRLKAKGVWLARLFVFYRRIMRLKKGG